MEGSMGQVSRGDQGVAPVASVVSVHAAEAVADGLAGRTPRGGLQAAEFEGAGLGSLGIDCRDMVYVDAETRIVLLRVSWANNREARLQVRFYRQAYKDVVARRAAMRLVS